MVNYNQEDLKDHHGIVAIIKNNYGEILIQEHVKYGFWTIPVGKVKDTQTIEQGLKEELSEECNIQIEDCEEITSRDYTYERNGNKVQVKIHLFEIKKYSGNVNNNEPHKHKQQIFLSLEKIKKLPYLSDVTLLFLETEGFTRPTKI